MKEFSTYTEFFSYYMGILDEKLPKWGLYMTMKSSLGGHKRVHREMPELTKAQVKELNGVLRGLVSFPEKVLLSYHKQADTWFAQWRPDKGKYTICYPTLSYYWIKYPGILKTVLLHELGHIFNGDSNVRNRAGHSSCTNICMDVRCNAPLDRESLMQLNDCLFYFEIKRPQALYVPEQFYPKIGLPILAQGWSFEKTHNTYHQHDFDDDEEKDPDKLAPWVPQIGAYVLITATKNKGKIAQISAILPSKECSDFYKLIDSKDKDEMLYDEKIDYDVLQRCEYELTSVTDLEQKLYTKQIKPSEIEDYLMTSGGGYSKIGGSLKVYGNYKRIDFIAVEPVKEPPPPPEPCECVDEKGNPTGEFSTECCPKPPPPPEPPPAQIGDVVMVKGEKYGKITDIKGGEKKKYTIQEVSVDVVNAILGTKLK